MKLKTIVKKLASANYQEEDEHRKALILNILLIFSSAAFLIINLIIISDYLIHTDRRGLPLWSTLLILFFLLFLLILSKRGIARFAAPLLVAAYAVPMFYSLTVWGADLPAGLLLAVLIIALSGILINSRAAWISTGLITIFMVALTKLQASGRFIPDSYWRSGQADIPDAIAYSVLMAIIATVAWLFARDIKRALKRARHSEAELKAERDSLEIKVIARTQELRQAEAEKISQLYRLAEFGRLSSGIFHDLVNPLTAVSLNLEQVRTDEETRIASAKNYLSQAIRATSQMEKLIASIKKQIRADGDLGFFSVNEEIASVLQIIDYKARKAQVQIDLPDNDRYQLYGDPVKFGQIITNLISNAIEACENSAIKNVIIKIRAGQDLEICVADSGSGIATENLEKIFEPFFSTKRNSGQGLGIGLSSTKNLVEKDFGGQIKAHNQANGGAMFIVQFPKNAKN